MPRRDVGTGVHYGFGRAQSLVAYAVLLPFLVVVLIVMLQGALYVHARNVVFGAVHEGAEAASGDGATLADGTARAQSLLQASLGQYARDVTIDGVETRDEVVVEAHGSMGVLHLNGQQTALGLPLYARARAVRETPP